MIEKKRKRERKELFTIINILQVCIIRTTHPPTNAPKPSTRPTFLKNEGEKRTVKSKRKDVPYVYYFWFPFSSV